MSKPNNRRRNPSGTGKDVEAMSKKSTQATADRLGVKGSAGVPIGQHLYSGKPLYGSWEDMHIWGPRTGKTAAGAVNS